jgi:hypothetical protein
VNVDPAIVRVPVRAPAVFAATLNVTAPFPVPLAPLLTVIQFTLLTAVHAQPDCVVTATGPPAPPELSTLWLVGAMVYMHAALCEMVTICPATVSVPVRAAPAFVWTEYVTVPAPVPLEPVAIVTQFTLLLAVHVQPDEVLTETGVPPPPVAPMDVLVGDTT